MPEHFQGQHAATLTPGLRALFYQPSCGISGDMHIGALVDLGVPAEWLRRELAKLPVADEFTLTLAPGNKMGISGTCATVTTTDTHDHRHHATIVKLIEAARLDPNVTARALQIFAAIAAAEGKIHDIPPEKVHFHEVGAVDSIVDIVAAALCIDHFKPDVVLSNPVEVGSGYVDCAHGRFPVPAPATQELLKGAPLTYGGVRGESTTPTGAAILAAMVGEFEPKGIFTPERIGYGVGQKDFERPNVLRVALGRYVASGADAQHCKIEANIDDMSPEGYEPLMQALFEAGAVDVYLTPIIMKKSRPAHTLTALCTAISADAVSDCLLNQSSTIGLRILPFEKRVLSRQIQSVSTDLGEVRVKVVTQPNGARRWKVEHNDLQALAQQHGLSYAEVKHRIEHQVHTALSGG